MGASNIFGKIQDLLDFEKLLPKVLIITNPTLLSQNGQSPRKTLESRAGAEAKDDVVRFSFTAQNVFPNTRMTNIELFLLFNFDDTTVEVSKLDDNGQPVGQPFRTSPDASGNKLTFEIDSLEPVQRPGSSKTLFISIRAPHGTNAPKVGNYQIGITGTVTAETIFEIPDAPELKPPAFANGVLQFVVRAD